MYAHVSTNYQMAIKQVIKTKNNKSGHTEKHTDRENIWASVISAWYKSVHHHIRHACTEQHLSGDSYSISISSPTHLMGLQKWNKNEFNWDVCSLVNCILFFSQPLLWSTILKSHFIIAVQRFHVISPRSYEDTEVCRTHEIALNKNICIVWMDSDLNVYDWPLCWCCQQTCLWLAITKTCCKYTFAALHRAHDDNMHRSIWRSTYQRVPNWVGSLHFWYFVQYRLGAEVPLLLTTLAQAKAPHPTLKWLRNVCVQCEPLKTRL